MREMNQDALNRNVMTVVVAQEWNVAQAQRAAKALAQSIGLSQVAVYSLATAVSELANNLFFHASKGGTLTLSAIKQNGGDGIEIIASDEGPGIPDIDAAR